MKYFIPKVSKNVCITDDINIAIKFSLIFNQKNYYLPIIEVPRISRPDASNEAIKINNSLAQVQPHQILYGNLKEEEKILFKDRFPKKIAKTVQSPNELEHIQGIKNSPYYEKIKWGFNNLGIGLLMAMKQKKTLEIDDSINEGYNYFEGSSGLLLVAEDRKDITSIIIANYAYAFDASLLFIEDIPKNIMENINDRFFKIYEKGINTEYELNKIKADILKLLPSINTLSYYCITFFTKGIPFGFAFPQIPCSHIFNYPFLGAHLCNYIAIEQNNNSEIKVGLLIDPGEIKESEGALFINSLKSKNIFIRKLLNKEATVNNANLFLAAYPADIILISSHTDEVKGWRKTYKYKDTENIERELVIDLGIGFGPDLVTGKFDLTEFIRFVSIDGIDWADEEAKSKHYIGRAVIDYSAIPKEERLKYEIQSEKIQHVHSAMAYKMYDGVFLPMLQGLCHEKSSIFISNACSSWRKVSLDVMVAGGRAYIGPIRDIFDAEAIEFTRLLFSKHLQRPICFGLWRTQKELYPDDIRRPYLFAGTHFTKFKFSKSSSIEYLKTTLFNAARNRGARSFTANEKDIKENSKRFSIFLLEELSRLNNHSKL